MNSSTTSLATALPACIACNSTQLRAVVPLAPITIATPVLRVSRDAAADKKLFAEVPLIVNQCAACGHLQLSHLANPEIVYRDLYVYTTSMSRGLDKHFEAYVDAIVTRHALAPGARVVEIGSNDGTLLGFLKARGFEVLGIDPARAIAARAQARGIDTLAEFFTEGLAQKVRAAHGAAALIIANNVIANVADLGDFTRGIARLLADDGVFVFETGYGLDVIGRYLVDTIYHEHLSYPLVRPLCALFERAGLQIFAAERSPSKGGSIRISVQRSGAARPVEASVAAAIAEEEASGIFGAAPFARFVDRIGSVRSTVRETIRAHRSQGGTIAAYGVSAGTTTLLAEFGIAQDVDVLIDDDRDKIGVLRGYNYSIPVAGPEALGDRRPSLAIVFAWRYAHMIVANNQSYLDQGGTFLVPLPQVSLHAKAEAAAG